MPPDPVRLLKPSLSCTTHAMQASLNPIPVPGSKRLGFVRGLQKPCLLTLLPGIVAKKAFFSYSEGFSKLFESFFAQVNIEVTRGHQSSNIPKIGVFPR